MSEIKHASDCAVHNGPAYPAGPCDCGAVKAQIGTGGMAFPGYAPTCGPWFGMSLRDYFAAKAMQAVPMEQCALHDIPESYERIARHAYKMADAMLAARKEQS